MALEFEKALAATTTNIPGMLVFDLPVHGDARGWFKENWQRAKQEALGLPDLGPVQNNISFNAERGVTRGVHAEPWDKYISVATGSVFGAWVDLRPGRSFGEVYTCELDPSRAIYIPRGVGNSFQALEDGTAYTYLVNAHWSAELKPTYTFVNLADPALGIEWPIPLSEAIVSEADLAHPYLVDALPMAPRRTLVTGCDCQLGRAVRALAEERGLAEWFDFCDMDAFDMSDPDAYVQYDWPLYGAVINCGNCMPAGNVETSEGRAACWTTYAIGPALMARNCNENGIVFLQVSHSWSAETFGNHALAYSIEAGNLAISLLSRHILLKMIDVSHFEIPDGVHSESFVSDSSARPEVIYSGAAEMILFLLGYRDSDLYPSCPAALGSHCYPCESNVNLG